MKKEILEQLWENAIEKSEEFGGHCDCGYESISSVRKCLFELFDKLEEDLK